jgi:menaquinone-dependent protoporphyrinogen oxidase
MRMLILYATTEGQTRKVAEHVADRIHALDIDVDLRDATTEGVSAVDFAAADAVILAASLYDGRYQPATTACARTFYRDLNARHTAFLSVSLAAASADPDDAANLDAAVRQFLHEAGWGPSVVEHVMGSLKWSEGDYFRQCVAKALSRHGVRQGENQVCELTDWLALTRFVDRFVAEARANRSPNSRDLTKAIEPREEDMIGSSQDNEPLRPKLRQSATNGFHR